MFLKLPNEQHLPTLSNTIDLSLTWPKEGQLWILSIPLNYSILDSLDLLQCLFLFHCSATWSFAATNKTDHFQKQFLLFGGKCKGCKFFLLAFQSFFQCFLGCTVILLGFLQFLVLVFLKTMEHYKHYQIWSRLAPSLFSSKIIKLLLRGRKVLRWCCKGKTSTCFSFAASP